MTDIIVEVFDPLEHWVLTEKWPKVYFAANSHILDELEQSNQIREDLEQDSCLEDEMGDSSRVVKYVEINGWRLPCPIRRVPASARRRQSDSSLNSSQDQKHRDAKSAPYRDDRYTILLEAKGSYLFEFDLSIPKDEDDLCEFLLNKEQPVPQDSLFREDIFMKTCQKIQDRNEAKVIQDVARLIVPSVEHLALYGATQLDHLIESVDQCWISSIPVEGPRPRPDYAVGFKRSAFTAEQLRKLDPLIGTVFDNSLFVATYRMYFPFLTCEVRCGATDLDVADRQNAHSMTVAVRALVELFRSVKREKDLNRKILAFSISHDHSSVRIYGHYPVVSKDEVTFYRHLVHAFVITGRNGKEAWTAYKLVRNVYDHHMPKVHELICSAIKDLTDGINFDLSQPASFPSQTPEQSNADILLGEGNG